MAKANRVHSTPPTDSSAQSITAQVATGLFDLEEPLLRIRGFTYAAQALATSPLISKATSEAVDAISDALLEDVELVIEQRDRLWHLANGGSDERKPRRKPRPRLSLNELRQEAESAIEQLIDLLDRTDPFNDEREGPEDDLEPSLGSFNDPDGACVRYSGDDRDLEADDSDKEPSLGWPEQFGAGGGGLWGSSSDFEQCAPVDTPSAREPYVCSKIDGDTSAGVIVERGCVMRHVRGLTDQQRRALRAKAKSGKVSV